VSEDRLAVLLALIAVRTDHNLSLPARVCRACVDAISISGAAITLVSHGGHAGTVAASDARSSGVHERQFTLGEGPGVDAFATGKAALEPDLGAARAAAKWPAFTPAAQGLGVAAAFAFPLSLGATRVGAFGLYRDVPGPLSNGELVDGSLLATITTLVLVAMQAAVSASSDELHPQIAGSAGPAVVHQATGMAMVQLGVTIAEASVVLRAYAFAQDRPIADVAADIVARRLVLE
jgi:ANTAR domain-containing protein